MTENRLKSFCEAASDFGVNRCTIADLVNRLGIQPTYVGKAKGLNKDDMRTLRKILGPKPEASATA